MTATSTSGWPSSCWAGSWPLAWNRSLPWSARAAFVHLVRSVFNERRKVPRNTLKKFYGLDAAAVAACSSRAGIDCGRRPESLQVEEFVRLLHVLPTSVPAAEG